MTIYIVRRERTGEVVQTYDWTSDAEAVQGADDLDGFPVIRVEDPTDLERTEHEADRVLVVP